MSSLGIFLSVFLPFLLVQQSSAKCVPGTVGSVSLSENYTLFWLAAENTENCDITSYVIYIKDIAEGTLQLYTVPADTLLYNVSFLDFCTSYSFEVHALTNANVLGPAKPHAFTTAPSADMNLALAMNLTTLKDNEMTVSWQLDAPEVGKCVSFYRLVYWDESDHPKDVYVYNTSYTLVAQIPCMEYEFQVRAIVGTPEIEGPFSIKTTSTYGQAPNPPKIVSTETTNTTATMVWNIDPYNKNRCEVLFLEVETIGAKDSPKRIVYKDSTSRPPFKYTLNDLDPDTVYTSHVYVVNNSGQSKNTTITFQTKDS